jgi:catalase
MTPAKEDPSNALSRSALQAFDNLNGSHPGYRPAHAKGILVSGTFTPSAGGSSLSSAPHLHRATTPVSVRLSDFAGIPAIPDNHPDASPRGIAIRFHLAEHLHTDIIAHSVDRFPTRTAEEFVEFLGAAYASGTATAHPTPIEAFLGAHPAALAFVQAPKPFPSSFATESFFSVSAYQFTSGSGATRYGRYRIRPEGASEYLDAQAAAAKPANYLFDELRERLAKEPVRFRILVQLAVDGDVVDDSTLQWPEERAQVEFGVIELTAEVPNNLTEQQHIIFDPIPRVEGIGTSGDPLLKPRADVYLLSGRRRRANAPL